MHSRDEYWRQFAERLRVSRNLVGASEEEAAAALRVTLKTYRKWERGERHADNYYGIWQFAKTYNIDIGWLVGGPERGQPPRFKLRLVS